MKINPWSNSEVEKEAGKLLDEWSVGEHSLSSRTLVFLLLVIIERLDRNFAKGRKG